MANFQQSMITLFDYARYNYIMPLDWQNAQIAVISTVRASHAIILAGA
jgi:hypothetical protein